MTLWLAKRVAAFNLGLAVKVLLYSPVFWPSLGGVEAISEVLCEELVRAGIDVRVVTETPAPEPREFPFPVIRRPSVFKRMELALWADVIHSNSASVALWPYAELARRPFIWTHNGYQTACIDGLGWEQNVPAPIAPMASFWHHWRVRGPRAALIGGFKLLVRRFVALRCVALNIPATRWVGRRLALPRSFQAYTPYPTKRFGGALREVSPDATYLFVGRLVSEKGVDVLLEAFKMVLQKPGRENDRLLVVGDGPVRANLETFVCENELAGRVEFTGALRGDALRAAMGRAEIAIVPSTWEEPMGGVTLELLATGRALIVSRRGGHAEVAGEAALVFENGDAPALAERMAELARDDALRAQLRTAAPARLHAFGEEKLTARYIDIYKALTGFWYR